MKILLVSIAKIDRIVIETIEKCSGLECVELYKYEKPCRVNDLRRHIDCFYMAIKAFRLRKQFKYVIFWQQFIGLYYNLLCKISLIKRAPKAIILTVIYIRRLGIIGNIYHKFFLSAFRSKYINRLVCHSSSEKKYYMSVFGNDLEQKIVFCKLGEGLITTNSTNSVAEKYFFSGGSSNRDYTTLIKAFEGIDEKLIIACKPENIGNIDIPSNVKLVLNTYDDGFNNLLKHAYSVVLPISDPTISSGQLVLLNAMKYSKSTIVTEGNCMADYIDKSYSMQIQAKSVDELRNAINLLAKNCKLNETMSDNAYNQYCSHYSIDKYAERIAEIVKRL